MPSVAAVVVMAHLPGTVKTLSLWYHNCCMAVFLGCAHALRPPVPAWVHLANPEAAPVVVLFFSVEVVVLRDHLVDVVEMNIRRRPHHRLAAHSHWALPLHLAEIPFPAVDF